MLELTRRLDINMGFKCNINCLFCFYGEHVSGGHDKTTGEVKSWLRFARKHGIEAVDFTGGEPTIRKDIVELVGYAREIGFRERCIITNGIRMSDQRLTRSLVDAGLNDAVFSIHGHIPTVHDNITRHARSFEKQQRGLSNLKDLGLSFRVNTVLTRQNYRQTPHIADFVRNLRPRVWNMLIFLPCDDAHAYTARVASRYSEVAPYVRRAIDAQEDSGIKVNVRYMPFCFMEGYEKHVCNFYQVPYDQDEWDYLFRNRLWHGLLYNISTVLVGLIFFRDYRRIVNIPLRNLFREAVMRAMTARSHRRSPACKSCRYDLICDGVWKSYASHFGLSEFKGVPGEKLTDPLGYRALIESG